MTGPSIAQNIPPEILEVILKDAVHNVIPNERSLTALTLSLVCRSFRRAALLSPDLWTCLSRRLGRPGLALIKACVERSKDRPLDVIFNFYPSTGQRGETTMVVDNIVHVLLDTTSRWRSCSIQLTGDDTRDEYPPGSPAIDVFAFSTCVKIVAPTLESFSIIELASLRERFALDASGRMYKGVERNFRPGAHWLLPKLRDFTLHNTHSNMITWKLLPQIESLKIGLTDVKAGFMTHIGAFQVLAAAKSLTSLSLSFDDCLIKASAYAQVVELPSVKTLHVEIIGCSQPELNEHALWATFCKLHFTNMIKLSVVVDSGLSGEDKEQYPLTLWNGYDITLHSLLIKDLAPETCYSFLETLDVSFRTSGGSEIWNGEASPILFSHYLVPHLKQFRIRAPWPITMVDKVDDRVGNAPRYLRDVDTEDPLCFQTVTFELPCTRGVAPWIRQLVSTMLDRSCWHGFSELRIVKEGVMEIVSRDDVVRWCDANQDPQIIG